MNIDVIIAGPRDLRPFHHLAFLTEHWRDAGHTVRTVQALSAVRPADIGVLHIDLTRIEPAIVDWARQYKVLINRDLTDISKTAISENLVRTDDGYAGPVIIKTDLNRGGKPEMHAAGNWPLRHPLRALRRELARKGAWRLARTLPPNDYPVLEDKASVPGWVWRDGELVVERFCPERQGEFFVRRIWVFLGDRGYGRRDLSLGSTGRGARMAQKTYDHDVPDEVRAFRRKLRMDYGKLDWVLHDGTPVVFDANRTPSVVGQPSGQDIDIMRDLARGIESFLT